MAETLTCPTCDDGAVCLIHDERPALISGQGSATTEPIEFGTLEYWRQSYEMVRDAVVEHLPEFIREDDVAEEWTVVYAIDRAARRIAELQSAETVTEVGTDSARGVPAYQATEDAQPARLSGGAT